jgi:hypothetical protein
MLGTELRRRQNYIDLFRAGAGSYALGNFSFTIAPQAPPNTEYHVMIMIGVIAVGSENLVTTSWGGIQTHGNRSA